MIARSVRGVVPAVVLAVLAVAGCRSADRAVPLPPGADPDLVRDVDTPPVLSPEPGLIQKVREQAEASRSMKRQLDKKDAEAEARRDGKYDVLVLSGGSADGAYQAGMLVGWSAVGPRPDFDVICGVSTGALVGAFVFPGPDYDCRLQELFTTTRNEDVFTLKKLRVPFRLFLAEGVADNEPLRQLIRRFVTPEYLQRVAAEHAKGRRFYVGTTNLDTKRFVVWDMGAIASPCTPEARELYCDVLAASSGITGLFPPTHIRVEIDGQPFDEMHVDGGSTRRLFFQNPIEKASRAAGVHRTAPAEDLDRSNLYVIVAGKLYGDPTGTPARSLDVAFRGISTMLEGGARGELFRLFVHSKFYGMDFHLASVPEEFETDTGLAQFDPAVMTRMFQDGYTRITTQGPAAWDRLPPEKTVTDEFRIRRGTRLTALPAPGVVPRVPPRAPKAAGGPLTPSYLR